MKNNIQYVWNNAEWTSQARSLIQGLNQFPQDSKIFVFIRHSHRKESLDANELEKLGLTELGCEIARIFGRSLPKSRTLRLFHSPSPRCIETAQNIIEGFHETGGFYDIYGSNSLLNNTKSSKKFITTQVLKRGGIEFIKHWHDNKFPKKNIIPFYDYCMNVYDHVMGILDKAQEGEICIQVTHDIFIMALRYGWFEFSIKHYWPSFLGGFAVSFDIVSNFLLDVGKQIPELIKIWNGKNTPLLTLNNEKGGERYG